MGEKLTRRMRTQANGPQGANNLPKPEGGFERRLRIAYVTMDDPNDRRSWSGTRYYMAQALEKYCGDVLRIGPLQPLSLELGKAVQRGVRFFTGKMYLHMYTTSFSKSLGKMAQKRLSKQTCDVIFAPAGSGILGHLHTPIPFVYLSDTTFNLMINYYSDFSNVLSSHIRAADQIERLAIQRAKQLVYPSAWAARSAIEHYHADVSRVNIIPFGANLDEPPSRERALQAPGRDRCRLLFVGVDWNRKGGDIAFETLSALERLGIPAELTIVGCQPPEGVSHSHLHVFPCLNKNNPIERVQLDSLYREATFFILPTRAECFSIALCEANAYGIPIVSTRTGGLPELVLDGVNGFLLPLEARGDQYAATIRDIYANPIVYRQLQVSTREQFESRLNWDVWGKRMRPIFQAAVAPSEQLT